MIGTARKPEEISEINTPALIRSPARRRGHRQAAAQPFRLWYQPGVSGVAERVLPHAQGADHLWPNLSHCRRGKAVTIRRPLDAETPSPGDAAICSQLVIPDSWLCVPVTPFRARYKPSRSTAFSEQCGPSRGGVGGAKGRDQGECCAMKARKRRAAREMKEGPSKPPCRRRLQTAIRCCGQKPWC
jgi:hypothetical protein